MQEKRLLGAIYHTLKAISAVSIQMRNKSLFMAVYSLAFTWF